MDDLDPALRAALDALETSAGRAPAGGDAATPRASAVDDIRRSLAEMRSALRTPVRMPAAGTREVVRHLDAIRMRLVRLDLAGDPVGPPRGVMPRSVTEPDRIPPPVAPDVGSAPDPVRGRAVVGKWPPV